MNRSLFVLPLMTSRIVPRAWAYVDDFLQLTHTTDITLELQHEFGNRNKSVVGACNEVDELIDLVTEVRVLHVVDEHFIARQPDGRQAR